MTTGTGPGTSARDAWIDAVGALWPGTTVEAVSPGSRPGGGAGTRRELAFLPNARAPRLLVPAGLPRAAASALRRYSHDLGVKQRASRALTAAAVRTGLPERTLRDRVRVTGGDAPRRESVEDRLAELLGRPVVVSIGLGSARANRKPILHVLSPRGEPLAFVKVGDTATTRALIDGEAAALAHLAERPPDGVHVPRLLHHGAWSDVTLLVLEPLPTGALGWRPRGRAPVPSMRALFEAGRRSGGALRDSAFWAGLSAAPDQVTDVGQRDLLAGVLERIEDAHGDHVLEYGAWHGDWTPWNMAWHRGRLRLWDWERFDTGVPLGFDLLHYRLQEAMSAPPPRGTESGPPYASWPEHARDTVAPLGLHGADAEVTVLLYLVELGRRYLLAAQEPVGGPLRADAARLLDLLHTRTRRTP